MTRWLPGTMRELSRSPSRCMPALLARSRPCDSVWIGCHLRPCPMTPCAPAVSRWVPVQERSRSLSLVYSGMYTGSMAGLAASPQMVKSLGWPSVFYIFGSLGLVWSFFWQRSATSSPHDDMRMSDAERKYVTENTIAKVGSNQGAVGPQKMAGLPKIRGRACRVAPQESNVEVIRSIVALLRSTGRPRQGFPDFPGKDMRPVGRCRGCHTLGPTPALDLDDVAANIEPVHQWQSYRVLDFSCLLRDNAVMIAMSFPMFLSQCRAWPTALVHPLCLEGERSPCELAMQLATWLVFFLANLLCQFCRDLWAEYLGKRS